MLIVENINLKYPGSKTCVLEDINMSFAPAESVALIGESGSGKTTLAKVLSGLLKPSKGQILWETKDAKGINKPMIGYVFQNYHDSLNPRQSIRTIFEESIALSRSREGVNLEKFVNELGLHPSCLALKPHALSGGMAQRIAVGRTILLNPDLLILDESTNALDYDRQVELVDLVRYFQNIHQFASLWITHDLFVATYASEKFCFMSNGKIVDQIEGKQSLSEVVHPYSKQLLNVAGYMGGVLECYT
jgi:ABC-type dipeptide/oligopeptide/nickel transport system ATPase subunit